MIKENITDGACQTPTILAGKIGFGAALLSAFFYIAFDIAAIASMVGFLTSRYWTAIFWYTPSIFLAISFVILMISIHYYAPTQLKILSHIAIALAGIYATLNCFVYICQVLVIAPSIINGGFDKVELFEMAPNKPLYAVNALAYSIMGLATLFSAFLFKGRGLEKLIKAVLILHGAVCPTIVGVLIWQPLFFISSSVGITYPLAAILIAVFFWKNMRDKAE